MACPGAGLSPTRLHGLELQTVTPRRFRNPLAPRVLSDLEQPDLTLLSSGARKGDTGFQPVEDPDGLEPSTSALQGQRSPIRATGPVAGLSPAQRFVFCPQRAAARSGISKTLPVGRTGHEPDVIRNLSPTPNAGFFSHAPTSCAPCRSEDLLDLGLSMTSPVCFPCGNPEPASVFTT
jgi:hypothetical protein